MKYYIFTGDAIAYDLVKELRPAARRGCLVIANPRFTEDHNWRELTKVERLVYAKKNVIAYEFSVTNWFPVRILL